MVYICLIFCASCNFCFKTEIQDKNKGTKNFPPEGEWIIFNFFPGFECGISLCTPYFKLFRAHLYICCIYWLGQELSQEIFTLWRSNLCIHKCLKVEKINSHWQLMCKSAYFPLYPNALARLTLGPTVMDSCLGPWVILCLPALPVVPLAQNISTVGILRHVGHCFKKFIPRLGGYRRLCNWQRFVGNGSMTETLGILYLQTRIAGENKGFAVKMDFSCLVCFQLI